MRELLLSTQTCNYSTVFLVATRRQAPHTALPQHQTQYIWWLAAFTASYNCNKILQLSLENDAITKKDPGFTREEVHVIARLVGAPF